MVILLFLYIVIPIIQVFFYISNNYIFDFIELINIIASITTLLWMLSNVLIASKVPFFQSIIPYDKKVKAHIIFSSGTILLVLYHGGYKFLTGYDIGITSIPLGIFFLIFIFVSIIWIPIPGFVKFREKIKSIPLFRVLTNYEFNKKFHIIAQPILGILIFIHIYYSGLFDDVPMVSNVIYLLFFVISYFLFILSKTDLFKYKCKVSSVDIINNNIVLLSLKSNREFNYRSGQFTFVGYKNSKGQKEEHPFSFISLGEKSSNSASFGIKILGDFTESLTKLKVNDNLWIKGVYGNFKPKDNGIKPIVLIGSGIGIVPIISIFKNLYNSKSPREISVFIAVNNRKEVLDFDLLEKAKKEMKNLKIEYLIYEEDGLLFSTKYFKNNIDDLENSEYYICCSPNVRKKIVFSLTSLRIKKSAINYEAFSF